MTAEVTDQDVWDSIQKGDITGLAWAELVCIRKRM